MAAYDPKVEEYIDKSADFAKPILKHLQQLIHNTCPDVVDVIKWGIPHFDYKGEMMCILAAYKQHCSFTFWKAALMSDTRLKKEEGMKPTDVYMGKISALADLPPDAELVAYIKEAMFLNENGIKLNIPKPEKTKVVEMPDYFSAELANHALTKEIFESKPPSFRKEYIVWIADAKTEATRQKRIEQSLAWIAEGKGRFWQYQK